MGNDGIFNLEKQFAFYGSFHNHPVNVAIHVCFVWPILFTFLILLAYTEPLVLQLHQWTALEALPFSQFLVLNYSFVLAVVYALFYVSMDIKSGSVALPFWFSCVGWDPMLWLSMFLTRQGGRLSQLRRLCVGALNSSAIVYLRGERLHCSTILCLPIWWHLTLSFSRYCIECFTMSPMQDSVKMCRKGWTLVSQSLEPRKRKRKPSLCEQGQINLASLLLTE